MHVRRAAIALAPPVCHHTAPAADVVEAAAAALLIVGGVVVEVHVPLSCEHVEGVGARVGAADEVVGAVVVCRDWAGRGGGDSQEGGEESGCGSGEVHGCFW